MKTQLVGIVLAWVASLALTGLIVMVLWNVLGLGPITYFQAVVLRLLFVTLKDGFQLKFTMKPLK